MGEGIADRRAENILDSGDYKADFTGLEHSGTGLLRRKYSDYIHRVRLAKGLGDDFIALFQRAILNPNQRDNALIIIEPRIDNQRLQWFIRITFRRRDRGNKVLQSVLNPHARLGTHRHGVGGIHTNDFFNFLLDPVRVCLRQIHLVQNRQDFEPLLNGGVAVRHGLRFHPLGSINYQQRAFAGSQRTGHFVGKVYVPGGVDEIKLVGIPVFGGVVERDALRLDRDTALSLNIHRIEHLLRHFTLGQAAAMLNKAIGQCRLTVVDMGNDRKVTNSVETRHDWQNPRTRPLAEK